MSAVLALVLVLLLAVVMVARAQEDVEEEEYFLDEEEEQDQELEDEDEYDFFLEDEELDQMYAQVDQDATEALQEYVHSDLQDDEVEHWQQNSEAWENVLEGAGVMAAGTPCEDGGSVKEPKLVKDKVGEAPKHETTKSTKEVVAKAVTDVLKNKADSNLANVKSFVKTKCPEEQKTIKSTKTVSEKKDDGSKEKVIQKVAAESKNGKDHEKSSVTDTSVKPSGKKIVAKVKEDSNNKPSTTSPTFSNALSDLEFDEVDFEEDGLEEEEEEEMEDLEIEEY